MTPVEVARLWVLAQSLWQNAKPLDDTQTLIVAEVLADVPFDEAKRFLVLRSRGGDRFPPNPGEIAAAVRPLQQPDGLPSWSEALRLLRRSGSRPTTPEAATAWLAEQSPALGAWVAERGWRSIVRSHVDDPEHGPRIEAELRRDFERFVAARPGLAAPALPSPARPAIEGGRDGAA